MKTILLALEAETEASRVLLPATVLTSWFGATLQIVGDRPDYGQNCDRLAEGLGVAAHSVIVTTKPFDRALAALAEDLGPSITVTDSPSMAVRIVRASGQPAFVVADGLTHRLPPGPLVLSVDGGSADLDRIALGAGLGSALDRPVLVTVPAGPDEGPSEVDRLWAAGCEVELLHLLPEHDAAEDTAPVVETALSRQALALILAVGEDEPHGPEKEIAAACAAGISVFVAPRHDRERSMAEDTWPTTAGQGRSTEPALSARLETLDYGACIDLLAHHSLARIGYVEGDRPMVVPVNYRFADGAVHLRSMEGGKVRAAERADRVCLEIDGYDEQLRCGWSVVVHGRLTAVDDPTGLREEWGQDPEPWVKAGRWHWLRLEPEQIEGRQVEPGID